MIIMEIVNDIAQENTMLKVVFAYIIVINVIAFILYGIDKERAIKRRWRVSEKTLLGAAMLGGSLGAILGMYGFHHKTKHWRFRILVPLFLLLHIVIILWMLFKI